jgi:hypothetical protein
MERGFMDRAFVELILDKHFGERRPTRWVTRARPKIDRIACPWLIRRFLDPEAAILYVPTDEVFEVARREAAVAFDIPGAPFTHEGDQCSFDAFLSAFALDDPGLAILAPIVRGADTDRHDLAPEASGLHALSLGLTAIFDDDQTLLEQGLIVYDAFYAWATQARGERHDWRPDAAAGAVP